MYTYYKETYKDFIIEIVQDEEADSPRTWDTLGTMVCWHQSYILGDSVPEQMQSRFRSWKSHYGLTDIECFERWKNINQKRLLLFPLYLYDHSGITMSTKPFSCPWDSGQVGYIYATFDRIKKEYGVADVTETILQEARSILQAEVQTYDQYLRGDVWGYLLKNEEGEILDSCWGFYGNPQEYCIEEARPLTAWSKKNFLFYFYQLNYKGMLHF